MVLRGLILLFSFAGLLDALYFTLTYYGRVKGARWVPGAVCARGDSSCTAVMRAPYARVLGVLNSLVGIVYYLGLIGWILAGGGGPFGDAPAWLRGATWLLMMAGTGAVLLGFYLMHALWRVLQMHCPLCYAAHAINAALLVLLLLAVR